MLPLLLWVSLSHAIVAQSTPYNGLRIALFDVQLLQIKGKSVKLKCRVANTGRLEAGSKKNAAQTIVELDTSSLPPLLWGHETAIAGAALNHIPKLNPGELSDPIWLDLNIPGPTSIPLNGCPDLVIDSIYLVNYSDAAITLRYIVSNAGSTAVEVAGKTMQLGVNVYFISGNKLTRGAIPAGVTSIQTGRETITGWLNAGQRLQGEMTIDLKNRTKFARNLLLELAPPPDLTECDRTNNTRNLTLKY